jgi:hypothetical protein
MRMLESWLDDPAELLDEAPIGQYLVEWHGVWRILWRLSEGEPQDGALEPVEGWVFMSA